MVRISGGYRFLALICALAAFSEFGWAGSVLRQDRAWRMYLNRTTGFCISYPSRWAKSETYDGSGLAVSTGMKKHSPIPVGSMDVSALAIREAKVESTALALDDDFDVQLAGLKKFARAQQVEILERRAFTLAASPSLFVKIRYLDPRDRRLWIDEVVFARKDGLGYRLELETRADQLQRFEANFTQFVNSFQMDCGSRATPASASTLAAFRSAQ